MATNQKILIKAVSHALSGKGAHVDAPAVFAGLGWKTAGIRPEGAPHSVFQLLNHMIYWQDWAVKWLDGKKPPIPKHASGSWPGDPEPAGRKEWEESLRAFRAGLDGLNRCARESDLFAKKGKKSRLEMLQTMAAHNSYHAGQVVLARQMLGKWPPPSGGLTW